MKSISAMHWDRSDCLEPRVSIIENAKSLLGPNLKPPTLVRDLLKTAGVNMPIEPRSPKPIAYPTNARVISNILRPLKAGMSQRLGMQAQGAIQSRLARLTTIKTPKRAACGQSTVPKPKKPSTRSQKHGGSAHTTRPASIPPGSFSQALMPWFQNNQAAIFAMVNILRARWVRRGVPFPTIA